MNPIGSSDLGGTPAPVIPVEREGDPFRRFKALMSADVVRKEIYDRTQKLIKEFRETYNCEPGWCRVSFDLNRRAGPPVYVAPCTVCGMGFREMLEENNHIEVGSSVLEDLPKKDLTGDGK